MENSGNKKKEADNFLLSRDEKNLKKTWNFPRQLKLFKSWQKYTISPKETNNRI